jgi:L-amino acid N-acyltransferase YncA
MSAFWRSSATAYASDDSGGGCREPGALRFGAAPAARTTPGRSMMVRIATANDAAAIAEIYAPIVERTPISFEVEPPEAGEIARRIAATHPQWPWLVADDGEILGYAYAGPHRPRAAYRWSVDVSAYVAERARRTGVGRRLYGALLAVLTAQGYYNAYAGVTLPNEPSVGLHRALGFEPVGVYRNVGYKFGAWHDTAWFARALRPPSADVAEPLAFAAIADRFAALAQLTT